MKHDLKTIAPHFDIPGDFVSARPYGGGHINDTYLVEIDRTGAGATPADSPTPFIFQRINHNVFKDPVGLMDNVERVTSHTRRVLEAEGADDIDRRTLTVIPTRDGASCHRDAEGNTWRAYIFIVNASTYDAVQSPEQAYQAARAFGRFQRRIVDLPGPRLNETIPDFHNAAKRHAAFVEALEKDAFNRAKNARPEIEFLLSREDVTRVLPRLVAEGRVPERITHNDTKFNNVMLDDDTGEGVCVIDLDTVMPGLAHYDFGDMVRTTTSPAEEDERDLSKVTMQLPMFEGLVRGYLESAGEFLNADERELLPFSGRLMTQIIGTRFVTDYLSGDTYFKVHREGHNLDRCRTQFKLVESIEAQEEAMRAVVEKYAGRQ